MSSDSPKNLKRELISWGKILVSAFIIALLINNFLIVNASIPSGSMESTIMTGDRVICNRLAYVGGDPHRFDIVVFRFSQDGVKENYIKRIIALPGETVEIVDGKVYIDGSEEPLPDEFVNEPPEGDYGPVRVPDNCYFVLGDNRNASYDSKSWRYPFVKEEDILGKAMFSYYPKIKKIDNYSDAA